MINDKALSRMLSTLSIKAQRNTGRSGSWHDGGASILNGKIEFYRYGLARTIPPEWKDEYEVALEAVEHEEYLESIKKDPEYPLYERLKQKFEKTV
jgi:hypothetical protein